MDIYVLWCSACSACLWTTLASRVPEGILKRFPPHPLSLFSFLNSLYYWGHTNPAIVAHMTFVLRYASGYFAIPEWYLLNYAFVDIYLFKNPRLVQNIVS